MEHYCLALNYVYRLSETDPLPSSAQLLMFHLLHENYLRGNPDTLRLSDRELSFRTGLSKNTITDAKRILKNRGLINFKTDRDKPKKATTYTILFSETLGQKIVQKVGQKRLVCYTLNQTFCSNLPSTTLSLPTEQSNLKKTNSSSSGCARDEGGMSEKVESRENREAAAEMWRYYAGEELSSDYLRDELARLIDYHGRETVKVALQEFAKSKGERFGYFEKILQTVLKRKGGKNYVRKPTATCRQHDTPKPEICDGTNYDGNPDELPF